MPGLPLVTIVTPSLNQAQFLEQAMLSVMGQDYTAVEYIVVDGGSRDDSVEIIRRHQDRLAYWTSEPDSGQSSAINKGFARAKGRIFAWLNSDDLLSPSAVSIAAHFLNSEPDVGLVYGDRVEIDASGNVIGFLCCPPHDPGMFRRDVTLPQETVFFRREVFETVGGLDEDLHFAMDLDLWCKMAKVTRMCHVPAFLASFRRHGWSKSVAYDATVDEKHQRYHRERELVMGRHFGRELPGRLERRLYHWRRKAALLVASRSAQHRANLATVARLQAGGAGARPMIPASPSGEAESVAVRFRERVPGFVSVVVPAYNAEKGLRRCIESILGQTYQRREVIVINDGSADRTEEVALAFGDKINYVRQENRGETASRNRGFELASGEFVTFIDHDDHWHPEFLATCVEFLARFPDVVGVGTGYETTSALSNTPQVSPAFLARPDAPGRQPFLIEDFFSFWAEHNHLHPGSVVLRGRIVDEAGGQRPDLVLSGDLEYWAYLATFGPWGFIPRVLLYVDGTQIQRGQLYVKYYDRYRRAPSVERWESRIVPRLDQAAMKGYERIRGYIATWLIFAKVFVGEDREGLRMARKYRGHLDGKFGALWRLSSVLGIASWKPMCVALRIRTRIQYALRDRKL